MVVLGAVPLPTTSASPLTLDGGGGQSPVSERLWGRHDYQLRGSMIMSCSPTFSTHKLRSSLLCHSLRISSLRLEMWLGVNMLAYCAQSPGFHHQLQKEEKKNVHSHGGVPSGYLFSVFVFLHTFYQHHISHLLLHGSELH